MTKERNGSTSTWAKKAQAPEPDKATLDAIADLTEYLTDTELKTTTGPGGEALVAVRRALLEDHPVCERAYALVELLMDRYAENPQRDIPANHSDPGVPYVTVLRTLQDKLVKKMQELGGGRESV